jgi:hypothetical protein
MTTFSPLLEEYYTSDCFDWDLSHSSGDSECPEKESFLGLCSSVRGIVGLVSALVFLIALGIAQG